VLTSGFNNNAVEYRIRFHVADYEDAESIRSEFITRVWYAARRRGLTLAHPLLREIPSDLPGHRPHDAVPPPSTVAAAFPQFGLSGLAEKGSEWDRVVLHRYTQGEVVLHEGEKIPGLFLILAGQAELSVRPSSGPRKMIARVESGEFFGERALLPGQSSDLTVIATEDLEVIVLPSETLQSMLERSPRLTSEIGLVMEARRAKAINARKPTAEVEGPVVIGGGF
jgi:CRP-like cAMP-binding protein